MNKVNLGDKFTHRITLRLNDAQHEFLLKVSDLLGVTPSDYLRMVVNTGMVSTKVDLDWMTQGKTLEGMVGMNENVKADIYDKL